MPPRQPKLEDLQTALSGSAVTVFFLCSERRFMWFENVQSFWADSDLIGCTYDQVFSKQDHEAFEEAFEASQGKSDPVSIVVNTRSGISHNGKSRTLKLIIRRVLNDKGERRGALCSSIDITEERHWIDTQNVLLQEVAHRSKNMLAMVLSIASQTGRASTDITGFMTRFTGRIQSLAFSQDAITEQDWQGVQWNDLIDRQVLSLMPNDKKRLHVTGRDLLLTPNAATHIGLALHELATHSLAFGALNQTEGAVSLDLSVTGSGKDKTAIIEWRDQLSEGKGEDYRDSFAKSLLMRVVPLAIGGKASLEADQGSVVYRLEVGRRDFEA